MPNCSFFPWSAIMTIPERLLTRRRLLQIGGIGALGLGLPQLLHAGKGTRAKSCIFIVQYGGASHHDSWDLKPDAPDEHPWTVSTDRHQRARRPGRRIACQASQPGPSLYSSSAR